MLNRDVAFDTGLVPPAVAPPLPALPPPPPMLWTEIPMESVPRVTMLPLFVTVAVLPFPPAPPHAANPDGDAQLAAICGGDATATNTATPANALCEHRIGPVAPRGDGSTVAQADNARITARAARASDRQRRPEAALRIVCRCAGIAGAAHAAAAADTLREHPKGVLAKGRHQPFVVDGDGTTRAAGTAGAADRHCERYGDGVLSDRPNKTPPCCHPHCRRHHRSTAP